MPAPAAGRVWLTDFSEVRSSAASPTNPGGPFPSWPEAYDSAVHPFRQEAEEVEVETTVKGESDIPPEVASTVEAFGPPAEADYSGGPLLVGAAWVEVPPWVYSGWQYSE